MSASELAFGEHYRVDVQRTEVKNYLQATPGIERSAGGACGPLLRRRRNRNGEIELGREDRNAERPESERKFARAGRGNSSARTRTTASETERPRAMGFGPESAPATPAFATPCAATPAQ